MLDHLQHRDLERYLRRRLSATELLETDRHLSACSGCLVELQKMPAPGFPGWLLECCEDPHLTYERLAAYIDFQLDEEELEIFENHISICPLCAGELRALQDFETQLVAATGRESTPAMTAARPSFATRFAQWFALGRWNWSHASAMALVLAAVGTLSLQFVELGGGRRSMTGLESGQPGFPIRSVVLYATLFFALLGIGGLVVKVFRREK